MQQSSAWFGSSLRTMTLFGLTLIAAAAGGLGMVRQNSEPKPAQPPEAKAKPGGAEMKQLGFYIGQWTYTETYPKSGAVNHGTYTSKLGPGGNSLLNTFHSQGPVGDFEGMLIFTWDLTEGKYKAYAFGDFPGAIVETGEFEGEKLVFHGEFGAGGAKIQLRNVTWMASPGKLISEEYINRAGAPETLLVKVEATKQ